MKCSSCDRTIRKGSGRKALVTPHAEPPRMGLVCARCFSTGTMHVVPPPVTIAPPCASCGREAAKYGPQCHENAATNVQHLSAANAGLRAVVGDVAGRCS